MSDLPISERLFEFDRVKSDFEDAILEAGIDFDHIGWDSYDNSLEIYGVDESARLSPKAQQVIRDAGFSTVFVNHVDKWETHYHFAKQDLPVEGWRVSYPHKRGPEEKGIWVESKPCKWPDDWFETGYAVVKEPTT